MTTLSYGDTPKPTFIFITVDQQEGGRWFAKIPFMRATGDISGAMGATHDEAVANMYEVMEGYVILCVEDGDGMTTIYKRTTSNGIQIVAL